MVIDKVFLLVVLAVYVLGYWIMPFCFTKEASAIRLITALHLSIIYSVCIGWIYSKTIRSISLRKHIIIITILLFAMLLMIGLVAEGWVF